MKKFLTICLVVIFATTTYAATITSITANNAATTFGGGTFAMTGTGGIIEYTSSNSYINGQFLLNLTGCTDNSGSTGIAQASFSGGSFSFNDGSTVLLAGSVSSFNIVEVFNGTGMLAGQGNFTVTSGTLQASFGNIGNMVNVSFFAPPTISDFGSGFSATSNMTVTSVPEPATIGLLSLGLISVIKRRNA